MSSSSTSPDPAKIQMFRTRLQEEWTGERTVAAWRKWHAQIAAFTRGATEAILEAAHLRPGMLSLAEELARKNGLANIEFREANAESLPFADATYDILTCRFGNMFFPDLGKALRECLRVLKPGGRAAFVAWGKKEQPFFTTTAGIILQRVPVPPPPPDPDGPSLFMFGERDRLRRALDSAGFSNVHEEDRIIPGRWSGSVEEYWEQFTEVAAPFRPLLDQLTPDQRAQARAESLLSVKKFWDGHQINLPLEIVIGSAMRP